MGKVYCNTCSKKCVGDVLKVGEKYFHQGCFICKDCNANLDAGGFFFRNDNYYCPVHYANRFSNKCFICGNTIISEVVLALNHHFHRDCFRCNTCNNTFAPGNRVIMKSGRFLCNSCSNNSEKVFHTKKQLITSTPKDIFPKCGDNVETDKEGLLDDSVTDQGYISADPISLSSPTQNEEIDTKSQSCKDSDVANTKSRSNTSRSLFEFGKFYRSSYLQIQEKQHEKEHQSKFIRSSSKSLAKSFFTRSGQQSTISSRPHKSHGTDMSSLLGSNRFHNRIPVVSENDIDEKENIIRLSSYPSGEKHPDKIPYPIERDDWPAPLSSAVLLQEKRQRKEHFFGMSVQSELDKVHSDNMIDYTHSLDHLAKQKCDNHQRKLLEVINTSPKRRNSDQIFNEDIISASRSPNASIEPITKPRFSNHVDKSKSRDSSYFQDPNLHYGYSLDFISSTSRPFLAGNPYNLHGKKRSEIIVNSVVALRPGYTKGLIHDLKINSLLKIHDYEDQNCANNTRNETNNQFSMSNTVYSWTANRTMSDSFDVQLKNSEYDLTTDADEITSSEVDLVTGLKSTRGKYSKDKIKDATLTSGRSSINSRIESLEKGSLWSQKQPTGVKPPIVSYMDLISKDTKILKYLDAHKLETYLSPAEFQDLFKLNRFEFYKLPEWKRNDLKRRVDLF